MNIFPRTFRISISKEIIMIILALLSTGLVLFEITHQISGIQYIWFGIIDIIIALIFLIDFLIGWYQSDSHKEFWKKRWWELFACIPFSTPFTQTLRGVGMLRLLRIVARVRRVGHFVDTLQFKLFSLITTVTVVLLLSSVTFYSFEFGVNPMVHNLFDCVWWAMGTVSSVGYGDIYPITTGGRLIGMFLMIFGVTALAVLVSSIVQNRKGISVSM